MSAPAALNLVIATRNVHKVAEIRAILGERSRYWTLGDFPGAPGVVEDAPTFAGNATKKAVELARWLATQLSSSSFQLSIPASVLADDSGLEVDALNGAPGVHSARFASLDQGPGSLSGNSSDAQNNAKLLRLLRDVPPEKRRARFRCVMALVQIDSSGSILAPRIVDGCCEGRVGFAPGGRGGFGYDPLFIPDGFDQTFAELGEDVKNRLSHRARALEKLKSSPSEIPISNDGP